MTTPQQAHEEHLRFQTLFEQAPFSVQLLTPEGRTTRVNKAWKALWQIVEGDGLLDFVLSEYNVLTDPQLELKGVTPHLRQAFAGVSARLPAIQYDPAELGKPGKLRWVRGFAHPVTDETGTVREVMLIHEDVSDQIEAEQALRASEARLKQLANNIPQLAWIAEKSGEVSWYNDRWYQFTGSTPEQMLGTGWQQVLPVGELPEVTARWEQSIVTGEPFQMRLRLRDRDGRLRPFFSLVAALKDGAGQVTQWFGTATDLSAIEDAEQGLRRAEEQLRLAVNAANVGIWDWDVSSDTFVLSDQAYGLLGRPPGTFQGGLDAFLALVHPDDRVAMRQALGAARTERRGFTAEFRVLAGGVAHWLSVTGDMHRATGGVDPGDRMVGATLSIDAYKQAEAVLQTSNRRKDEFLAMLAHELRNPLAPISTAAHVLRTAQGEHQVRRVSEIITRQVGHISHLLEDLLDVSRVTRGLVELNRLPVDLKAVASSAVEQVRPLIESRRHVLVTRTDGDAVTVRGDSARLIQVVANLLNNAAKYTPEGGELALQVDGVPPHARIVVRDNGSGIAPDLLPRVFDLFTQGERSPDRAQGGLGIGLALVKSIVELHGGQVTARGNDAAPGSTFTVTLPLIDSVPAAVPDRVADQPERPLRIVIVDDNRDAAASLDLLLSAEGHAVETAHDAAAALRTLEAGSVDVYILDIGLPDMDGYALAARLKAQAPRATFIALTGYGQPSDRAQSLAAGFDHHVVKPADAHALMDLLSRVR